MCQYKRTKRRRTENCRTFVACLLVLIFLLFSFSLGELLVGSKTNSLTLVADSFNTIHQALAIVIIYVSFNKDSKPWRRSTFGWARLKLVGTVINSVFIFALCFHIALRSFRRVFIHEKISDPITKLIVGALSLAINALRLVLLKAFILTKGESTTKREVTLLNTNDDNDTSHKTDNKPVLLENTECTNNADIIPTVSNITECNNNKMITLNMKQRPEM